MPIVHFADTRRKVECVPGTKLRDVALRERYQVYKGFYRLANCRGHGLCGSCRIAVLSGRTLPRNDVEKRRLKKVPEPWRLACQVQVLDNITVTADEAKVAEVMREREVYRQEVEAQLRVSVHQAEVATDKVEAAHEAEEAARAAKEATHQAAAAGHEAKVARDAAHDAPEGEARTAALASARKAHEAAALAMREAGLARDAAHRAKEAAAKGDEATCRAEQEVAEAAVARAREAEAEAARETAAAKAQAERAVAEKPKAKAAPGAGDKAAPGPKAPEGAPQAAAPEGPAATETTPKAP